MANKPLPVQRRYYTVPEVAEIMGLGRTKVYELINRRVLPSVRIDAAVRVPVAGLERWLLEHER